MVGLNYGAKFDCYLFVIRVLCCDVSHNTRKTKWQCSQYLTLNPTCDLVPNCVEQCARSVDNFKNLFVRFGSFSQNLPAFL